MAINEVNTTWAQDRVADENFIELKMIGCSFGEKPIMKRYLLLTIGVVQDKISRRLIMEIDLVAKLYHETFKTKYFVIGSDLLGTNVDLKLTHHSISGKYKTAPGQRTITSSFFSPKRPKISISKSEKKAMAVFLLKAENAANLPKFPVPPTGTLQLEPNDENWNKIKSFLYDALMLIDDGNPLILNEFYINELISLVSQDQNDLEDVLLPTSFQIDSDKSLNRCPSIRNVNKRFNFQEYKRGTPTPRQDNDCVFEEYLRCVSSPIGLVVATTITTAETNDVTRGELQTSTSGGKIFIYKNTILLSKFLYKFIILSKRILKKIAINNKISLFYSESGSVMIDVRNSPTFDDMFGHDDFDSEYNNFEGSTISEGKIKN